MPRSTLTLTPVILSGGSGTRLWPLSRPALPKQFIALTAEETLLRLTLGRVAGLENVDRPIIVANALHGDLVEQELKGEDALLVLEPCARNTAPAIALAALLAPESVLLVMPSDHVITNVPAFQEAVTRALPLAETGWLMMLGIQPESPETGYGYIALGDEIAAGVQKVRRFIEKPDRPSAETLLAQGNNVWNAGIFLFRADAYLDALGQYCPEMLKAARAAIAGAGREGARVLPDAEAFARSPSNSIDYAVMEQATNTACAPVDMGWSDVGSWDALYDLSDHDAAGNAADPSARLIEAEGCLARSDGPHISLVGVEDLIVVVSGNEVLVTRRGMSQLVKKAAEEAARR